MVHTRRAILGTCVGGVSAFYFPTQLSAATQCVTAPLPAFLPNRLSVDCASARNFRAFRQNPDYLGLAGTVSMSFVQGKFGAYQAGNLFLYPWLKPKGQGRTLPAAMPTGATQVVNATPIPDATLPLDEYFCRYVLQAPWTSFIGFHVDVPFGADDARRDWFTNVDKLADGKGVGIDWTSANLNNPWFGGSHWVPNTDPCSGNTWRRIIVAGLNQASAAAC